MVGLTLLASVSWGCAKGKAIGSLKSTVYFHESIKNDEQIDAICSLNKEIRWHFEDGNRRKLIRCPKEKKVHPLRNMKVLRSFHGALASNSLL